MEPTSGRSAAGKRQRPVRHRRLPLLDDILNGPHELPRWIGWRLRLLALSALAALVALFMVGHALSTQPHLPFALMATPEGKVRVTAVHEPALLHLDGAIVRALGPTYAVNDDDSGVRDDASPQIRAATALEMASGRIELSALLLTRSGRWIPELDLRERFLAEHHRLHTLIGATERNAHRHPVITLDLLTLPDEMVSLRPLGWRGLSPQYWLLCALALLLFCAGSVVLLAGPQWRNVAYAVLTTCQAGQLVLMAVASQQPLFAPQWLVLLDTQLRVLLDLCTAAAMVQVALTHPHRLAGWAYPSVLAWGLALALAWRWAPLAQASTWLWVQLSCVGLLCVAIGFMSYAHRTSPHPFTLVLQRFSLITLGSWALLSFAVYSGTLHPDMQLNLTTVGLLTWHAFFASQLLMMPYLAMSRQILREFSLLAASSTVAASLDLLFVAVFSLGQLTSMTLSIFLAFGSYMLVRGWLSSRLAAREPISMERLFERLYRLARELELHPERTDDALSSLFRQMFDPMSNTITAGRVKGAEVRGNGSVLLIGLPHGAPLAATHDRTLVLKHAQKGTRLFTTDDARLAERITDQLQRALRFDQAVEQGRSEERVRIAQDLHDDIGARLLTLMYQAPNADIEEYIRHTLQDLKTLTRGLAAQSHVLSEAASEWKRDINQRLAAARSELHWHMELEIDPVLTMVQWSALTRILRELVSNTISHAQAKQVEIELLLKDDVLRLCVRDNGQGRQPDRWSHGLGLGGVRKRVKQLNGHVQWSERTPAGIQCEVVIEGFTQCAAGPSTPDAAQLSH